MRHFGNAKTASITNLVYKINSTTTLLTQMNNTIQNLYRRLYNGNILVQNTNAYIVKSKQCDI